MVGIFLKKEFETSNKNFPPNTRFIEFVGTAPKFRGRGLASHIIQHIIENKPSNEYVIEEVADMNTPAMRLYEKLGFEEYRRKPVPKKVAKKMGIHHFLSLKYVEK
jgi:ribosomal protein S18 acetylase RimI-like enzyme